MSPTAGEIYVNEVIRDACPERLDDLFGQGQWRLLPDLRCLNLDALPGRMVVKVRGMASDAQVATLLVENEFYVEDIMGLRRRVAARPVNIQINIQIMEVKQ